MQNESSQSPCVPKPLKNLTLGPSTCKTMLRQHRSQRFVAIISFETSLSLHRYFFSHIDFTLAPNRASSLGFTLIFCDITSISDACSSCTIPDLFLLWGGGQDLRQALLLECAGAKLNSMLLDFICPWLATSPMARANGIACCNRATNIAWRRMHYALVCDSLQGLITYFRNGSPEDRLDPAFVELSMLDLGDIIGLVT